MAVEVWQWALLSITVAEVDTSGGHQQEWLVTLTAAAEIDTSYGD